MQAILYNIILMAINFTLYNLRLVCISSPYKGDLGD